MHDNTEETPNKNFDFFFCQTYTGPIRPHGNVHSLTVERNVEKKIACRFRLPPPERHKIRTPDNHLFNGGDASALLVSVAEEEGGADVYVPRALTNPPSGRKKKRREEKRSAGISPYHTIPHSLTRFTHIRIHALTDTRYYTYTFERYDARVCLIVCECLRAPERA